MADLARDEADRFFSTKVRLTGHPDDVNGSSDGDSERADERGGGGGGDDHDASDPGTDDDDLEFDTTGRATAAGQARARYHLPSTAAHANTGPKGVIADAQSFERAKRQQQRQQRQQQQQATWRSNTTHPTADASNGYGNNHSNEKKPDRGSDDDDDDDDDSAFMQSWRQKRLQELSSEADGRRSSSLQRQQAVQQQQQYLQRARAAGTVADVDAAGYLDAVEGAGDHEVVVVLIYDRVGSSWSRSVELELGALAYKYSSSSAGAGGPPRTRFIKLDQAIAEMESVEIPAVLAYRRGDVFATLSAVVPDELEDLLQRHGVLPS